jgi:hypothetical protein
MYSQNSKIDNLGLTSGIISFRKLSEGYMPFYLGKNDVIGQELINEFQEVLEELISEIWDESIPFRHNAEAKWCKFCQ